jgi:spermidine synthase
MLCKLLSFLLFTSLITADEWYSETFYTPWRQSFEISEKLYEEKNEFQHLLLFKNPLFGTVLAIDGIIQVTEKDEFFYHEFMTHVALLAHNNPKKVLIIGGGDGGILREVLKHPNIEKVTLVEIDASVVAFSQKYLPFVSKGSFEDPRLELVIADGAEFVKNCPEQFDIILCDSTDPIGPGAVLFTSDFYRDCHALLGKSGILVNQNGVCFMQPEEITDTYSRQKEHFKYVSFYFAAIPTYVGGNMAFGFATDDESVCSIPVEDLKERLKEIKGQSLKYYTPEMHKAAFALPQFILDAIKSDK